MEDFLQPDIGLKNVMDVIRENLLKKNNGFPYAGLWIFSGQQGAGKTLLMMHLVREMHEQYPNAIIVSNISIFGLPCVPFKGISDFDKYANGADGCIFVIDEIHILFNALESAGMPLSTMQVWAQNRKNRRVILGTSQRFNRVAKGVREQTLFNYECFRPLLGVIYSYKVFDGALYDDMGKYIVEDEEDRPRRHFYVPNVSVMRMYNTLEVVRRDDFDTGAEEPKKSPKKKESSGARNKEYGRDRE